MHSQRELLMVGMSAKTYRVGNIVRKEYHILLDEPEITAQNYTACRAEAEVYLILGSHQLIAQCTRIDPEKKYLELEYYPNGNLKSYLTSNWTSVTQENLQYWACQMIQSVAYIHSKGVRHSDIRLDQWLVDAKFNARLSDFNASGFDERPNLNIKKRLARGIESPSHYLPRDPDLDSTVESDLFALGSALYELVTGHQPYEALDNELIESRFRERIFPDTDGLFLGDIIAGCWHRRFYSAQEILDMNQKDPRALTPGTSNCL